jgi:hypothetical protein
MARKKRKLIYLPFFGLKNKSHGVFNRVNRDGRNTSKILSLFCRSVVTRCDPCNYLLNAYENEFS